ncbi:ISSpo9, transposase [Salipiger mucosus DSM 16094]|uniref:ISSpo9, transposase n=1 Tax=Salipiger mucosus DSM 16094 TaxID=1123237 RepID=S9R247_9RHOB|nr:ISSpo9, transposase [Salipiger mucosus DSM 16094]
MISAGDHVSKAGACLFAQGEVAPPNLAAARLLVHRFVAMVHDGKKGDLAAWLVEAAENEIASFARGLTSDLRLVGLDWAVPDFSTLSRRQKTLAVSIPYRGSQGPLNLPIPFGTLLRNALPGSGCIA